jgi:stage II sporulation protein D
MTGSRSLRIFSIVSFVFITGCSRALFVKPAIHESLPREINPPKKTSTHPSVPSDTVAGISSADSSEDLDFAQALQESATPPAPTALPADAVTETDTVPPPVIAPQSDEVKHDKGPRDSIDVRSTDVRIALRQNCATAVLYSLGEIDILAPNLKRRYTCRGRIGIETIKTQTGAVIIHAASYGKLTAALPCTLMASGNNNYFEFGEASYRGSFAIIAGRQSGFSVINIIDVEEYLRGVVALEIGKCGSEEIEAVKAQAVAARTYTYRRMQEKKGEPFDLLPDVSDQVYGGVNAEHPVCDRAIDDTRGVILAYGGDICMAYYHSTCGGHTANVEDVWEKSSAPYLRGVSDTDDGGRAYCAISPMYSWEERWTPRQLGGICSKYGSKASPPQWPDGAIRGIVVRQRFNCGRVKSCEIRTEHATHECGRDRIRFILRRNRQDFPILRSSNFEIIRVDGSEIVIRGKGYGHGVGMCQMGAIGRARKGQSFEKILKNYYSGAELKHVRVTKQKNSWISE